jgi:4-diphosphocytidyl-2-C-methyl-D-erythritol kinase
VKSLQLAAPAKVNLSLRILGRRSDGYHDLDTVMQKLDLCDLVTVSLVDEPGVSLRCPDSNLPEDSTNIAFRAAGVFLETCSLERVGVQITLEKRIPIAAGLVGGSSDAGAVLLGLNRLLGSPLPTTGLIDLAKSLGADVPFFVTSFGAVRAQGIGDRMTPVPSLQGCRIVLANPGFPVSTRHVFEKYALTTTDKKYKIKNFEKFIDKSLPCAALNDLESATLSFHSEIEGLKLDLLSGGASLVLMSGSGPTYFGIFPDENGAESTRVRQAVQTLQQRKNVKVFVTQPV